MLQIQYTGHFCTFAEIFSYLGVLVHCVVKAGFQPRERGVILVKLKKGEHADRKDKKKRHVEAERCSIGGQEL